MTTNPASGTAKPFINPFLRNLTGSRAGNKVFIEPGAQKFFASLNSYDQLSLAKGIDALRGVKYPIDGGANKFRPMFWRIKKDPGTIGNYLIRYEVFSDRVTVTAISLNRAILGAKNPITNERNAMYRVSRAGEAKLHEKIIPIRRNLDDVMEAWGKAEAVSNVSTDYAAVNGMLNEFEKAVWLMGVHLDSAYAAENPQEYTLFHNTSQYIFPDLYESVRDQLGFATQNAKHLAAVLQQIQTMGKPVKWVVHSQGGIIFKEAIRYHLRRGGGSLNKNSVIIHAGGNNKAVTNKLLALVGIKKNAPDKDNPFDMVPKLAGLNDLSCASIKRCVSFSGKVMGSSIETESPHTLPFISLDFYRRMLIHSGDYQRARQVKHYMDKTE